MLKKGVAYYNNKNIYTKWNFGYDLKLLSFL